MVPYVVDIEPKHLWYRFANITLRIRIPDTHLTGKSLQWRLYDLDNEDEVTVLMTKTGVDVIPDSGDDTIANINISSTSYALALSGRHWHELWDRTNQNVLASGSATLLFALPETIL